MTRHPRLPVAARWLLRLSPVPRETRAEVESDLHERVLATLTAVVGAIAIVLCVIGLYGLTASVVGQRAREMAVRAAIGADPWDLLRLLMWDSLRPVVIGLAAGAGAALLASRVIAGVLFGVSPQDPIAFAGAAAILLAAATLAVLVPTRRAASVDAASVLKAS